jgi:hypothetical protein
MCTPSGKFNVTLKAAVKCDQGHNHDVTEAILTDSYQEAVKRVKRFWEANRKHHITFTGTILADPFTPEQDKQFDKLRYDVEL